MRGFYDSHPEFEEVPVYIYGQSYGGKMAIDIGIEMRKVNKIKKTFPRILNSC